MGQKGRQGGQEEQKGKGGPVPQAVHSRDLHIGFHGKDPEAPGEDQGIREIRQGVGEDQEPGAEQPGHREGEGHRFEGLPPGGPEVQRRVLQSGIDGFEDAHHGEEGDGEHAHGLDKGQPPEAVDGEVLQAEDLFRDKAVVAEEQDDGQGEGEGGRDDGEGRHG
ncbi:hypothetical protein SDC9_63742 [bioreactor metagenome]|uniref:Uncharacterized protein n=1 Tax=bioreactor metagenome TaxID=1076179 RepID=A0A644XSX2_9ZZZZ